MADRPPEYGSKAECGRRCPRCHGPVVRIRRRVFDRLVGIVSPRHRFRCAGFGCDWEGTLRAKR